jgi:nucleoside-diphosphate-sugar epimerase
MGGSLLRPLPHRLNTYALQIMPTIAPGAKVLVTGANGFLAIHVVDILLKKGYTVRGVVRSPEKGDHLKKLFAKYGDKLELAIVKDITAVRHICFGCIHSPGC